MLDEAQRHLERVIHRTLRDAKLAGRNTAFQNDVAARTLRLI